ncbi:MAG: hypothetical protein Q8M98_07605 [Candidatus Cloacimonadaceae bacterium]|nr:hypothetical protein [Candidatus Cloacimonadaceae bacterium]MDP3114629.1 hypothetical protein [Candidatus Cloacimonadaceae bacterium]
MISISVALDALELPWTIDLISFHTITDTALIEHINRCGISIG